MTPRMTFRRKERLHGRAAFDRVFAGKQSAGDSVLVVYIMRNDTTESRLGIVTSRRVGPAVKRNHARRRIREAFRKNKHALPKGIDIVCIAKSAAANKKYDVAQSLLKLLNHLAERFP